MENYFDRKICLFKGPMGDLVIGSYVSLSDRLSVGNSVFNICNI